MQSSPWPPLSELLDLDPPLGALKGVKVVLLNGPPGSGKDTAGRYLNQQLGVHVLKFAGALKRGVYVDHGLPADLPLDYFESVKDQPLPVFHGKSFREACIHKSEVLMKPAFGDDTFGRLFLRELFRYANLGTRLVAVTDSGFVPEAMAMIPHVGVENMLLIRVHADARGKTFASDSRSHIDLPGVKTVDIENNKTDDTGDFLINVYAEVYNNLILKPKAPVLRQLPVTAEPSEDYAFDVAA